ncbi:MAG: Uma2 family endonuclease [Verrucomicrobiota bacterium]
MAQETLTEMPVAATSPPAKMTYEEFLRWDGENQHVEWVDGKVVLMSPITMEHSNVSLFLLTLVKSYVEEHHLGRVLYDPFQMKTGPALPGRAPDILFVANKNLGRLQRLYLDGPADLVVEVISPGSRAVDRGEKFYEYEQGGVPEYWLIDPQRKQAEFYQLGEDGIYRLASPDAEGNYRSRELAGLWLKVNWLWQEPLPPLLTVLKEWKLI